MSSIKVVSAAEIPARTSRHIKTGPLREKIASLTPETSLFVSYYSDESNEGYRASTIAQITGRMTKESNQYKYSVQSEPTKNGCYIICKAKS
jgi:hypothetical protein